MATLSVYGVLSPFCSIFHGFGPHFEMAAISWQMLFFSYTRLFGLLIQTFDFKKPHRKKSWGVKSSERGGHSKSPFIDIQRPGNNGFKRSIVARAVCSGAPSCWNQKSSIPLARTIGIKKTVIIARYRAWLTVSIWPSSSEKKYGPMTISAKNCQKPILWPRNEMMTFFWCSNPLYAQWHKFDFSLT